MALLLRILGMIWLIATLLLLVGAVVSAMAERPGNVAFAFGAFMAACVLSAPAWLTGVAFFLLPGWIRKQLGRNPSDTFS